MVPFNSSRNQDEGSHQRPVDPGRRRAKAKSFKLDFARIKSPDKFRQNPYSGQPGNGPNGLSIAIAGSLSEAINSGTMLEHVSLVKSKRLRTTETIGEGIFVAIFVTIVKFGEGFFVK